MAEPPAASHSAQRQPRHEDGEAADGAKAAVEGDCDCTSDGKDSDGRTSLTRSTSKTLAVAANMQCGICMDILHKCVTLLPCLHNFCAGCYSDWMAKSDGCPQCREVVEEVSRNHTLNNIIEAFVIANPQLKRDADDLESLDARDKLPAESLRPKKRQCSASRGLGGAAPGGEDSAEDSFSAAEDSFSDDDDGFEEWLGHQCVNCARPAPNGFICPTARTADQYLDTRHHNCDFCLQNFPNSASAPPSGSCGGCNRVWCGPYMRWFAPSPATDFLADAPMHQACWSQALPLEELEFEDLPREVMMWNQVERQILENCMQAAGFTPATLFRHCLSELRAGRLQCLHDRLGPAHIQLINIQKVVRAAQVPGAQLCRACVHRLAGGLFYSWREAIPAANLPHSATSFQGNPRQDCWYGSACRTQVHNANHANNKNHVCTATR